MNSAITQQQDAVGDSVGFLAAVGHPNHRGLPFRQERDKPAEDAVGQRRVEIGQRFVQQKNRRTADQCPPQGHPLFLPSGKGRGPALQKRSEL